MTDVPKSEGGELVALQILVGSNSYQLQTAWPMVREVGNCSRATSGEQQVPHTRPKVRIEVCDV